MTSAPPKDCQLCPRLCAVRAQYRAAHPAYYNGAVPAFSAPAPVRLLIVGLAPGLHGANATGRPFTADYAGDLLYPTLIKFGFARGNYAERADDGLELIGCRITNAVRCVPPENKPTPEETKTCGQFLKAELQELMQDLRVILALGQIAHQAVLRTLGQRVAAMPFGHGTAYPLPSGAVLLSSYHCSRYNTNTGRLTTPMFEAVFEQAKGILL